MGERLKAVNIFHWKRKGYTKIEDLLWAVSGKSHMKNLQWPKSQLGYETSIVSLKEPYFYTDECKASINSPNKPTFSVYLTAHE